MIRVPLFVALACCAPGAQAATFDARVAQDGAYSVHVMSLKDARFATTLRQQYDFSCGSAALATLLTFHYGHPVNEQAVFTQMYQSGDRARIRQLGFSLLDMKRYLNAHGYLADGFEVPVQKLADEHLPAIVLLSERGYRHFVVVKGLRGGRILIGDPAMGTRAMSLERFHHLWSNNIVFVIHDHREGSRFNTDTDWRVAPPAPLELAIEREDRLDTLPAFRDGSF